MHVQMKILYLGPTTLDLTQISLHFVRQAEALGVVQSDLKHLHLCGTQRVNLLREGPQAIVLRELAERTKPESQALDYAQSAFGFGGSDAKALMTIIKGLRDGQIDPGPAATVLVGFLLRRRTEKALNANGTFKV